MALPPWHIQQQFDEGHLRRPDSDKKAECTECYQKARGLLAAIAVAQRRAAVLQEVAQMHGCQGMCVPLELMHIRWCALSDLHATNSSDGVLPHAAGLIRPSPRQVVTAPGLEHSSHIAAGSPMTQQQQQHRPSVVLVPDAQAAGCCASL